MDIGSNFFIEGTKKHSLRFCNKKIGMGTSGFISIKTPSKNWDFNFILVFFVQLSNQFVERYKEIVELIALM